MQFHARIFNDHRFYLRDSDLQQGALLQRHLVGLENGEIVSRTIKLCCDETRLRHIRNDIRTYTPRGCALENPSSSSPSLSRSYLPFRRARRAAASALTSRHFPFAVRRLPFAVCGCGLLLTVWISLNVSRQRTAFILRFRRSCSLWETSTTQLSPLLNSETCV